MTDYSRYPLLWALLRLEQSTTIHTNDDECDRILKAIQKELQGLFGACFQIYKSWNIWQTQQEFTNDFFAYLFLENRLSSYVKALELIALGTNPDKNNAQMFAYIKRCIKNWAVDVKRKQKRHEQHIENKYEGDITQVESAEIVEQSFAEKMMSYEDVAARRLIITRILHALSHKECALYCIANYPILCQMLDGSDKDTSGLDELLEEAVKTYSKKLSISKEEYREKLIQLAELPESLFSVGGFKRDIVAELTGMKEASVYAALSRLLKNIKNIAKDKFESDDAL